MIVSRRTKQAQKHSPLRRVERQADGGVRFFELSQIEPHAPLLVVRFRQFLQVSSLRSYFPSSRNTLVSLGVTRALVVVEVRASHHNECGVVADVG